MNITDSVLTSIKKLLGIAEEYEHFDADLIMHINSVFSILTHITLHMKKLSHIAIEIIGRCHVLWELIYHKATISVHSHFYSHCRTDHSASKPETTFPHRL